MKCKPAGLASPVLLQKVGVLVFREVARDPAHGQMRGAHVPGHGELEYDQEPSDSASRLLGIGRD